MLNTRDLHCLSTVPVNSLLCGNCCWSRLLGKSASGVYCQSAIGTPSCASPSASVADLLTRCCPLPLAADDADFMSSLVLGFGSGSTGFTLSEWDVDAANFSAGAAVVTVLRVSFLCSPHCISSANASLMTSLLRSNVSATSGVILETFFNSYSATI